MPTPDRSAIRDAIMLYSNFAAILAGFAFTAVIVIISHFLPRERLSGARDQELGEILTVGISAFFSLSITAVTQGTVVVASDDVYRTALGGLLSGLSLSFSALLLTLFLVLLLEALSPESAAAKYTRHILGQVLPLLCFANQQGPLEECLHNKFGNSVPIPVRIVLGCFFVILVSWSIVGFLAYGRGTVAAAAARYAISRAGVRRLVFGTLCACLASTTATALYMNYSKPGSAVGLGVMMGVMTLAFLGFLGFSVCTFLSRPTPRPAD
ncbi:hypothetical protein [Streptomyces sp. NPDC053079]|uniref:hypothetical protein n=1 Tax=Streptomyces sp. NPDC053079 TaxID=3365697 RepID=UPI0037CFA04F